MSATTSAAAVTAGLRQSANCGTTALGEIAIGRSAVGGWEKARADVTCYFEVMARSASSPAKLLRRPRRKDHLPRHRGSLAGWHQSPFTVHGPARLARCS